MNVTKLYADYQKLERNSFWAYFFEELEERKKMVLDCLGKGETLSEAQLRVYQGRYRELCDIADFPVTLTEKIGNQIQRESDKDSSGD